jgi:prepilin-type N-terminal cleavage/methylation domain-containing protein
MKRPLLSRNPRRSAFRVPPSAFTLVELLVVITIIGILTSLVTAAAVTARRRAKIAAVVIEVKQLEMACQAYKEKFGEYPPDFAGLASNDTTGTVQTAAQNTILRHLARAFPRYQPGISKNWTHTGWAGLIDDLAADPVSGYASYNIPGWGLDVSTSTNGTNVLSALSALTFWLGGKPDWLADASGDVTLSIGTKILSTKPVKGFLGFSANPANPFDASPSRIQPFFEFDLTCLSYATANPGGITFWPGSACDRNGKSPVVYFRANNGTYFEEGATTSVKFCGYDPIYVFAAADTRLSTFAVGSLAITWINPSSFQIFCSGLDASYGTLTPILPGMTSPDTTTKDPNNCLAFPTGENYAPETYDDITNFSGGTLEDKIP